MRYTEFTEAIALIKFLTPDQSRIKSLKDQAKRSQEAVKAERARQKIAAGQQQLKTAIAMSTTKPPSI
jgi:hypothetical protein